MIFDSTLSEVRHLVEAYRSISSDVTVAIVANIKASLDYDSEYPESALATEYFSEYEISQIIEAVQDVGAYVKVYPGEDEFINAVLCGEFANLPRRLKVVYNSAQSGSGPGRKSLIPAFCQLHGIPVCNSNPYVTGLARHKYHVASLLKAHGLPACPSWYYLGDGRWLLDRSPPNDIWLIAKAAYESASIGLTKDSVGQLCPAFMAILNQKLQILKQPVVVQHFIEGFEVEVPLVEFTAARPLGVVSITLGDHKYLGERFLDFDIVNHDSFGFASSDHFEPGVAAGMADAAVAVFDLLGISGLGRVDFRVTVDGAFHVTDVATSPHLVAHSSFAWLFHSSGLPDGYALALLMAVNARRFGWI